MPRCPDDRRRPVVGAIAKILPVVLTLDGDPLPSFLKPGTFPRKATEPTLHP